MAGLEGLEGFFGDSHEAGELQSVEDKIFVQAKYGDLFEPDITRGDWEAFCVAAEKEEVERRSYVPAGNSQVTEDERTLLARADTYRDEGAEQLLEKREKLARAVRPQCTDANSEEEAAVVEKLVNEEFGIEDWGSIDTSIGGGL
jgi:hypothetical protein